MADDVEKRRRKKGAVERNGAFVVVVVAAVGRCRRSSLLDCRVWRRRCEKEGRNRRQLHGEERRSVSVSDADDDVEG